MYKKLSILVLAVTTASCSIMPGFAKESTRVEKSTAQAAWDLQCKESEIKITKISETAYGAEGCGKRASYVMINCSSGIMGGAYSSACKVIHNSGDGAALQAVDATEKAAAAAQMNAINAANQAAIQAATLPPMH